MDARNLITHLHRINGGQNVRPTKVMSLLGSAVRSHAVGNEKTVATTHKLQFTLGKFSNKLSR